MRIGRTGKYLGAAIAIVAAGFGWFFLAPPQLGGSTSYVVITGNSMEPLLHADDLAVVRETDRYEVGDVAAYESDRIGQLVLHRIVERADERFVLQGDNNDFLDPEKPTQGGLSGKLWANVPRAGFVFRVLRSPAGFAFAGAIMLSTFGLFSTKKRRRKRSGRHLASRQAGSPPPPPPPRPSELSMASDEGRPHTKTRLILQSTALLSAVLLLAFGLLGMAATALPAKATVEEEVSFEHAGRFSYSAPAPQSAAYDGPMVTTGEPVFLNVIDELTVTFHYRFATESPHDITTNGSMTAQLGADNGLNRTIKLRTTAVPETDALSVSSVVELDEIRTLVRAVEKETGIEQAAYTLTIAPEIDVSGSVLSQELDASFAPELDLQFDGLQLRTSAEDVNGENPALTPDQADSVTVTKTQPNEIALLGRRFSIQTAERVAVFGGGVAAVLLMGVLLVLLVSRPRNEAARIEARYGSALIRVSETPLHADAVQVSDFPTLMRLAEQFEQPILHNRSGGIHVYMVPHEGILYRYRTAATRSEAGGRGPLTPKPQRRSESSADARPSMPPPPPPPRVSKEPAP